MLAKACFNLGDYLLWRTGWFDQSAGQAQRNQAHGMPLNQDMLLRIGQYAGVQNQLTYNLQAYQQINICTTIAWKLLPAKGEKSGELGRIRQGPEEPYSEFVPCLLQAVGKFIEDLEAGQMSTKQLAFEITNKTCRAVLRPQREME